MKIIIIVLLVSAYFGSNVISTINMNMLKAQARTYIAANAINCDAKNITDANADKCNAL